MDHGGRRSHPLDLSCDRFHVNAVQLLLGVIAYNLGALLRRLVPSLVIQSRSLTSLHRRLFKSGGRFMFGTSSCGRPKAT